MMKKFFVLIAIVAALLLCSACGGLPVKLDAADVSSISFSDVYTLTSDADLDEIEAFVNIYNKSKRIDDGLGTTHPCITRIKFNDKSEMDIWSGTQGFITVANDDVQFNVENTRLEGLIESYIE